MAGTKDKIVIDFLDGQDHEAQVAPKSSADSAPEAQASGEIKTKPSNSTRLNRFSRIPLELKAREEALKENYKELFKQRESHEEKLNELLGKSDNTLVHIRNIIPIFKDEIVIDANKITVINRPFFFSEQIQAVSIKNINDVFIQTAPFLASIHIVDVGMAQSHIIHLKWFLKKDAEKARRLITGLMQAAKEQVDIKKLDPKTLGEKLEELGKIDADTTVSST